MKYNGQDIIVVFAAGFCAGVLFCVGLAMIAIR